MERVSRAGPRPGKEPAQGAGDRRLSQYLRAGGDEGRWIPLHLRRAPKPLTGADPAAAPPGDADGERGMTAHIFKESILREYDIRGIVGETLDGRDARALGRAFGTFVLRGGGRTVALGYDGRLSSPELAAALAEGRVPTCCASASARHRCFPSPASISRPTAP